MEILTLSNKHGLSEGQARVENEMQFGFPHHWISSYVTLWKLRLKDVKEKNSALPIEF